MSRKSVALFSGLLLFACPVIAGSMSVRFDYSDVSGLRFYRHSGYDRIAWEDAEPFSTPGEPVLPARTYTVVVPPWAGEIGISCSAEGVISLGDGYLFQPAAVPRPFSRATLDRETVIPDPEIYGAGDPWPSGPLVGSGTGHKCGFRLVSFRICPFSWVPDTGELLLATGMEVEIDWQDGGNGPLRSTGQIEGAVSQLEGWVHNPEDLAAWAPVAFEPLEPVDFLVVTSTDYSDSFSSFVSYKSGTGLATEMVYISDIISSTPGYDDAEKLRNYLIDRYENDGLQYVLLAGDQSVIPTRTIYLYCEGYSDNAPVDLYYSDLDGNWDGNGDHSYGQPEDDLDLYSDVAVGRALFDTGSEAALFVERSIMYEQSPPPGDWQSTAMLCGGGLFTGYTGAKVCDSIAVNLPGDWEINKAYEPPSLSDGFTTHIDIINDGTNWVHYAGHGNTSGVYWQTSPTSMMTNSIAQGLNNGDKAGIHHSIACHPGAFHSGECCAEALWHNAGGGAASVMFNSSYGWEGYLPEMGVSEWMCVYLTEEVFQLANDMIGCAFATSKDRRVPLWSGDYDRELYCIMDWCAYHDPTMHVIGAATGVADESSAPMPPGFVQLGGPYPNPCRSGSGPVMIEAAFGGQSAELMVYGMSGRLLGCFGLDEPGEVSLSELLWQESGRVPAGVYLLRLCSGESSVSGKLVVLD